MNTPRDASEKETALRLGRWSAVATAVLAAGALAIGILTPARSGPFCVADCVTYPYTDVAAFAPRDYWWMIPIALAALTFVALAGCLHSLAGARESVLGSIGLGFAVASATVLTVAYFTQLFVVQPALLQGETDGLVLLSMYNPHGVFIALEDLGLFLMSVSFLFLAGLFASGTRLDRALRWLLGGSAVVVIAALPLMSVAYGQDLGYRYEVLAILVNWVVLVVAGALLAVRFRTSPVGH